MSNESPVAAKEFEVKVRVNGEMLKLLREEGGSHDPCHFEHGPPSCHTAHAAGTTGVQYAVAARLFGATVPRSGSCAAAGLISSFPYPPGTYIVPACAGQTAIVLGTLSVVLLQSYRAQFTLDYSSSFILDGV